MDICIEIFHGCIVWILNESVYRYGHLEMDILSRDWLLPGPPLCPVSHRRGAWWNRVATLSPKSSI